MFGQRREIVPRLAASHSNSIWAGCEMQADRGPVPSRSGNAIGRRHEPRTDADLPGMGHRPDATPRPAVAARQHAALTMVLGRSARHRGTSRAAERSPQLALIASVDLGATNPNDGDTVTYTFKMPDGTNESVTLTATTTVPLPANSFAIGATSTATAANLQTALTSAITNLDNTSLVAASAMAASDNFFNSNPPLRVGGPGPLASSTALVAGTPANTLSWYTGENGATPARATAQAIPPSRPSVWV